MKLLLDTDIGSDIDDAVCLAYLLAQPACDLLGITTVTGESRKRAMLASALCRVAEKDIPIYPGTEQPLLIPLKQTHAPQADALDRWSHQTDFPQGEAVDFLRRTIRQHPGEITLLAIGPLTNIGLLFAVDPEIPFLLKQLVIMCGVFTNHLAGVGGVEWNAIGDPHATAIVYQASAPIHRSIGLDVTCRVKMDAQQVRERFTSPLLQPVLDWAEIWFQRLDTITFHDPLAAATLFDEGICGFERGTVSVELLSDRVQGMTHWRPDEGDARHEVALTVTPERFFNHYFQTVS